MIPWSVPGLPGVCALVLALSACTVLGPDYEEPEPEWLGRWQPELYGQATVDASAPDLGSWWQRFEDPLLNELMAQARRANPGLRIAGLRLLESRAVLGIATGLQLPQVQQINASGVYGYRRRDGGIADGESDFSSESASLNLGWELDFWGRFQRNIESANAAYFSSQANHRDVQVLLAAQVARLYYGYKTTLQRVEITQRNVDLQRRSFEITELLYRRGQGSELDLQAARAQYLATRAALPALRLAQNQQRNALGALLGRAPGDLPELDRADSQLPEVGPVSLSDLPAQLLTRRPDVRAAAWQAAAQSARVGLAEADLYPSISLVGTIGWSGSDSDVLGDVTTVAGGPSLRWDIFNYGRLENAVRAQDARLQQALESYQNTVLNAAREIDDAASRIAESQASQRILDESLEAAERSLEIATRRYREGYSDFQRVLDAQGATFAQSDRVTVNRGDYIAAMISLYQALGGGWENATIETLIPEATRDAMRERTDWGELLDAPLAPTGEAGSSP